jgi:PAS domain S-box-containing protein
MSADPSLPPLKMDEPATEQVSSETLSQLRGSELLLDVIANNVAELIAVVDSNGRRIWNNAAYAERLGYQPEVLKGSDSMVEIHPDDVKVVRDTFAASMQGGIGRRIEYRMRHKDGSWIFLESEGRVARNWNGHDRCLVVVARDITAQKQEERKKEERSKLRMKRAVALAAFTTSEDLQGGELEKCFAKVVETAVELSGFERVSVWTMDGQGTVLNCRKRSSVDPVHLPAFTDSKHAAFFNLLRNQTLIAARTLARDNRLHEIAPVFTAQDATSLLIVPLRRGSAVLGALICERSGPPRGWDFDEASFATSLAHRLVLAIDARERIDAYNRLQESQEQLSEELREASAYVQSLLPAQLQGEVETDWRFIPSEVLGGDAFGYHWIDPDHLLIYLLDVVGHGVRAAVVSLTVMDQLRTGSFTGSLLDPKQVLTDLNAIFQMDEHDGMYFTLWYGIYHKSQRLMRYASAGHPPALLFPMGVTEPLQLHTPGLMIGALPGVQYEAGSCYIEPGSRLYVFSDGVYEIQMESGASATLRDLIGTLSTLPSDDLDSVISSARAVQGSEKTSFADDFSIVKLIFR